ncbi:MAG: hypothetical protein ACI87A_002876, partial [Planctomycetota bacterium]
MSLSASSLPASGHVSFPKSLGLLLAVAWFVGCISAPESTTESEESYGIEELTSMVTEGSAEPIEGESEVLLVGVEGADPLDPSVSTTAEMSRIEAALVSRIARETAELKELRESGIPKSRTPNPYLTFGERIVVHPDGRITKPYALPPGKGKRVLDLMLLMSAQGMFPIRVVDAADPGEPNPDEIQAVLL